MIHSPKGIARFNALKRIVDTSVVLVTLPVTSVVAISLAIPIWWSMGRPIIYRQRRIGYKEKEFYILKFRTMSTACDSDGNLLPDSARLTAIGRILRRTSLDEVPQLLNVLRGEMVFVGPRPLLPSYLPYYSEAEKIRHEVRPGVTGLAQVSGRNSVLWDERLRFDATYARAASVALDVHILIRTFAVVLRRKGVSVVAGDTGEPLHIARQYPKKSGYSLRRLEAIDIPLRVLWFRDRKIREHMSLPADVTVDTTTKWLQKARTDPHRQDLAIYRCDSGAVVAMAGVIGHPHSQIPELYILVDPEQHNRGIGRISLSLVLDWLQQKSSYRGCWLTVAKANLPAIALYTAAGFVTAASVEGQGRQRMELIWEAEPA